MKYNIPVARPDIGENELNKVTEAVKSGWVSSKGPFIEEFEEKFSNFIGVKNGVSTSNGTTALHLALKALNIGINDKVLIPTLTFVATANVVKYVGAEPIFIDSDLEYWCMDPEKIEEKIDDQTKAIIVVHLYGHPCDMDSIMKIAKDHNLYVIEDAAEAHGAEYKGKKVGSFGNISCFSFYGNKIITTGEGGMCLTNDDQTAIKMRVLRDHGMNPDKRYWYDVIGYNYRMTNLQAALGVAQIEKIDKYIDKKRKMANKYNELLNDIKGIVLPPEKKWAKNIYWMYSILIDNKYGYTRDELIKKLNKAQIESRPFFHPISLLPMYRKKESFPIAEKLSMEGINLPSSVTLTKEEIEYIVKQIKY